MLLRPFGWRLSRDLVMRSQPMKWQLQGSLHEASVKPPELHDD
jgi:hypothetical protein